MRLNEKFRIFLCKYRKAKAVPFTRHIGLEAAGQLFQWEERKTVAVFPTYVALEHTLLKTEPGVSPYGNHNYKSERKVGVTLYTFTTETICRVGI